MEHPLLSLSPYIYIKCICNIHTPTHTHLVYFPDSIQGDTAMNDMPQDKHLEEALGSEDKAQLKCNRCC